MLTALREVPPTSGAPARAARVLGLLRRHGYNPTAFQILDGAYRLWFGPEAVIAYVDTGRTLVVAGAPVCATDALAEVTQRFLAAARRRRRAVAFFDVHDRFLAHTQLPWLPIGELYSWDPQAWPEVLAGAPSLREQLRRARAKGVRIERLGPQLPALQATLQALRADWLARHGLAPLSFLAAPVAFGNDPEQARTIFLASRGLQPVGYLCLSPIFARRGVLVQEWVRAADAPNGTTELLLDAAFRFAARGRMRYATLGLSPLAGALPLWLRAARTVGRPLFDFEGLRAFKAKLRPQGREIAAVAGVGGSPTFLLLESLRAFAGGSFADFGAATLRKRLAG